MQSYRNYKIHEGYSDTVISANLISVRHQSAFRVKGVYYSMFQVDNVSSEILENHCF